MSVRKVHVKNRDFCVLIVHALLLMTTAAVAQDQPVPQGLTLKSDARLVVLPLRVLDAKRRPVEPPLPQSALNVFEDGVEQTISVFRHEDAPASVTLLIDHSGSMSYKLQDVTEGALTFVAAAHPQTETSVISFSQHTSVDAVFTSDISVVTRALGRGTMRGNTALWDAIQTGIRHMNASARYQRRIVILLSDGEDAASSVQPADLVRSAQSSEVTGSGSSHARVAER